MRYHRKGAAVLLAGAMGILLLSPAADVWAYTPWAKNNGTYVDGGGTSIGSVTARGIDISHWNQSIDWAAVARDDVQFVMLGTRYNGGVDPAFHANASGAFQAGLKVGAYIYSYATTADMARQEAEFILNVIKDYPISYPVVFDAEDSSMANLSAAQLADIINAFCKTVEDAGYYPMVYSSDSWLTGKIDMSRVKYDVWSARYDARPGYGRASMWQATNAGAVRGISGSVNIDFAYKDFSGLIPAKTWRFINGKWYYYNNYQLQKGWINDGYDWYFMQSDGTQYKGWLNDGSDYYYLKNETGQMITGWMQLNNQWYYFKSDGRMARGWAKVGDLWYYLKSDGTMATGWIQLDGSYYYLHTDGRMLTGWLSDGSNQYYMNPTSGKMASGWKQIDEAWYYFNSVGHMQKGWINIGGKSYYLDPSSGKMYAGGTYNIGNVNYTFDAGGACLNQGASSLGTTFPDGQAAGSGSSSGGSAAAPGQTLGAPGSSQAPGNGQASGSSQTPGSSQAPGNGSGSMGSSAYNDFYSGPGAGITGGPAGDYNSGYNSGYTSQKTPDSGASGTKYNNWSSVGIEISSPPGGSSSSHSRPGDNFSGGSTPPGSQSSGSKNYELQPGRTDGPGPGRK